MGFPRLRRICKPKDSTRLNPSNLHPPSTPLADFHLGTASPSTPPSPPASDLLDFPSFVRGVVYVLAQSMVEYPPNRVFLQDSDGSSRNVSALAACVLGALADLQSHSQDAVARPRPAASNTNLPQSPQGMVAPVADGPSGAADSGDGNAANIRHDEAPGEDSLLKVVMPTKSEGGRGAPAPATSSAQDGACGNGVGESEWGMLETRAWELMLALFRLACPDETWSLINKGAVDVLLRALPSCPLLVQHRGFTRLLHFLDPSLPSVASNLELLCRGGLLMQVFRAYEAILRDETHSLRIILLKLVERVAGFRVRGIELRAIQELLGSDFPEFFLRMHTFSQSFGGCAPAIEFRVSRLNYACLHIAPFDPTVSSVPGGGVRRRARNTARTFQTGHSVSAWINLRSTGSVSSDGYCDFPLILFEFAPYNNSAALSMAEALYCVYIERGVLSVKCKGSITHFATFIFQPLRWYHIVLTHRRNRLSASILSLYVNGMSVSSQKVPYSPLLEKLGWSNKSEAIYIKGYLGTSPHNHEASCSALGSLRDASVFNPNKTNENPNPVAPLPSRPTTKDAKNPSIYVASDSLKEKPESCLEDIKSESAVGLVWWLGAFVLWDGVLSLESVKTMWHLGPAYRGSFHAKREVVGAAHGSQAEKAAALAVGGASAKAVQDAEDSKRQATSGSADSTLSDDDIIFSFHPSTYVPVFDHLPIEEAAGPGFSDPVSAKKRDAGTAGDLAKRAEMDRLGGDKYETVRKDDTLGEAGALLVQRYLCQTVQQHNDCSLLMPTSCLWDLQATSRPPLLSGVLGALRGSAFPVSPRRLSDSVRSVGSVRLVFALLAGVTSAAVLWRVLRVLRVLLHCNLHNRELMTEMRGYELLAHYLKAHTSFISIQVVEEVVLLCLPSCDNSPNNPNKDAHQLFPLAQQTPNSEAIQHILFDDEIWRHCSLSTQTALFSCINNFCDSGPTLAKYQSVQSSRLVSDHALSQCFLDMSFATKLPPDCRWQAAYLRSLGAIPHILHIVSTTYSLREDDPACALRAASPRLTILFSSILEALLLDHADVGDLKAISAYLILGIGWQEPVPATNPKNNSKAQARLSRAGESQIRQWDLKMAGFLLHDQSASEQGGLISRTYREHDPEKEKEKDSTLHFQALSFGISILSTLAKLVLLVYLDNAGGSNKHTLSLRALLQVVDSSWFSCFIWPGVHPDAMAAALQLLAVLLLPAQRAVTALVQLPPSLEEPLKFGSAQPAPDIDESGKTKESSPTIEPLLEFDFGILRQAMPLCHLHLETNMAEWTVLSLLFGVMLGQPQQSVCGQRTSFEEFAIEGPNPATLRSIKQLKLRFTAVLPVLFLVMRTVSIAFLSLSPESLLGKQGTLEDKSKTKLGVDENHEGKEMGINHSLSGASRALGSEAMVFMLYLFEHSQDFHKATIRLMQRTDSLAFEQLIDTCLSLFMALVTRECLRRERFIAREREKGKHAREREEIERKGEERPSPVLSVPTTATASGQHAGSEPPQETLTLPLKAGFSEDLEAFVEQRPAFGLSLAATRLLSGITGFHVFISTKNSQTTLTKVKRVFSALFKPVLSPEVGHSLKLRRAFSELQAFVLSDMVRELSRVCNRSYLQQQSPSVLITLAALFESWTEMDLRSLHATAHHEGLQFMLKIHSCALEGGAAVWSAYPSFARNALGQIHKCCVTCVVRALSMSKCPWRERREDLFTLQLVYLHSVGLFKTRVNITDQVLDMLYYIVPLCHSEEFGLDMASAALVLLNQILALQHSRMAASLNVPLPRTFRPSRLQPQQVPRRTGTRQDSLQTLFLHDLLRAEESGTQLLGEDRWCMDNWSFMATALDALEQYMTRFTPSEPNPDFAPVFLTSFEIKSEMDGFVVLMEADDEKDKLDKEKTTRKRAGDAAAQYVFLARTRGGDQKLGEARVSFSWSMQQRERARYDQRHQHDFYARMVVAEQWKALMSSLEPETYRWSAPQESWLVSYMPDGNPPRESKDNADGGGWSFAPRPARVQRWRLDPTEGPLCQRLKMTPFPAFYSVYGLDAAEESPPLPTPLPAALPPPSDKLPGSGGAVPQGSVLQLAALGEDAGVVALSLELDAQMAIARAAGSAASTADPLATEAQATNTTVADCGVPAPEVLGRLLAENEHEQDSSNPVFAYAATDPSGPIDFDVSSFLASMRILARNEHGNRRAEPRHSLALGDSSDPADPADDRGGHTPAGPDADLSCDGEEVRRRLLARLGRPVRTIYGPGTHPSSSLASFADVGSARVTIVTVVCVLSTQACCSLRETMGCGLHP